MDAQGIHFGGTGKKKNYIGSEKSTGLLYEIGEFSKPGSNC